VTGLSTAIMHDVLSCAEGRSRDSNFCPARYGSLLKARIVAALTQEDAMKRGPVREHPEKLSDVVYEN